MSSSPPFDLAFLAPLRHSLSTAAQVLLPSDTGYDAAIQSWNHDFSARPPLVLRPACTADVVAAINFLRDHPLPFTVGGGMHSRFSKREGHVLLSLCLMRTTTVDRAARLVRAQGGALNGDVDKACAKVNMHCPMGTYPDTGIGGLVLGGGLGFLSRRQGLSLDCLQEVELVTADGRVVRASDSEQPELFWAMRGAGYNFGVVTELVLRIQPVGHQLRSLKAADVAVMTKHNIPTQEPLQHKIVRAGLVYPQSQFTEIVQTLQSQYIEPGRDGPLGDRDLMLGALLRGSPNGPVAMVLFIHTGDVLHAYAALDQLLALLGQPLQPLSEAVHLETYLELQHAFAAFQAPGHHHDRAFFAMDFSQQLATACQQSHARLKDYPGMEKTTFLFLLSGVQSAIGDNAGKTAIGDNQRRGNVFVYVLSLSDADRVSRTQILEWCNNTREAILPHCSSSYTNSSNGQPGSEAVYGDNLPRLRQLKQKWDPTNLFCNNQNVVPADMDDSVVENAHLNLQ